MRMFGRFTTYKEIGADISTNNCINISIESYNGLVQQSKLYQVVSV